MDNNNGLTFKGNTVTQEQLDALMVLTDSIIRDEDTTIYDDEFSQGCDEGRKDVAKKIRNILS